MNSDSLPKMPDSGNMKKAIIAAALALCVMAVSIILSIYFFKTSADPYGNRILNNVVVGDVCVGGMTKKEAKEALSQLCADYAQQDMVLNLPGVSLRLSPEETGTQLRVKDAVNAAFAYGRNGTAEENRAAFENSRENPYWVDLTQLLHFKEGALEALVAKAQQACRDLYAEPTLVMRGQMPDLTREDLDETTQLPEVDIYTGRSSLALDAEDTLQKILWAYNCHSFTVDIPQLAKDRTPEPMDIKKAAETVNIAPVDFTVDKSTLQIVPGAFGCAFDVTAARRAVMKAGEDENITIPMQLKMPAVPREEAYFQDILGYCETPHGTTFNRNTNMKLACGKINNLVLQPGDSLSYNELLGQRTEAAGYLPAPAYSGTSLIQTPGGGICQVSSTLYLASMYAELTALERVSHGFKPHYMEPGTDATVSWPYPDLKLQNNLDFPIKIKAEVTETQVRVWIMGTEIRDYDVKIETRIQSSHPTYISSYLCKYDKETNEQISKEYLSISSYLD